LAAEERAACLWGSDGAYFLINGSSGGILAGIYAAVRPGDSILMTRNCHKSVYHAVELLGLCPVYLDPPLVPGTGITGSVPPGDVERALVRYPDIRLAVITSPTYEGVLSDVRAIADILHGRGIPLLTDEAHGAHLGLSSHFPTGAVQQGADLVVQSLHKTLPSLTQTAVLHRSGGRIDPVALRHALGVFQSTSPSYLFLAAMDGCVALLEAEGESLLAAWRARLTAFYQGLSDLAHLRLLGGGREHVYAHDPGKIAILCGGTTLSSPVLMDTLRKDFGIELEMALEAYALAMTSPASTEEDLSRLGSALKQLDRGCEPAPHWRPISMPPMPEQMMSAGEAMRLSGRQVSFAESVGEVSRAYVWAYPPGVPLVVPGVLITSEIAACLAELQGRGVALESTFDAEAGMIEIVDKA